MNVDLNLMMLARNYAVKLQQQLDHSRKCHYDQVAEIEGELQQTRNELAEAYRKLDHLQSVLNPAKEAEPRQKNHR